MLRNSIGDEVGIVMRKKGKGSPYWITERRVPELIPVFGSQPAGDVSHEPGCRLVMGVNSLPKTVTRQRRDCDLNPGLLRLSPAR